GADAVERELRKLEIDLHEVRRHRGFGEGSGSLLAPRLDRKGGEEVLRDPELTVFDRLWIGQVGADFDGDPAGEGLEVGPHVYAEAGGEDVDHRVEGDRGRRNLDVVVPEVLLPGELPEIDPLARVSGDPGGLGDLA